MIASSMNFDFPILEAAGNFMSAFFSLAKLSFIMLAAALIFFAVMAIINRFTVLKES